jgi:hypothetical protein
MAMQAAIGRGLRWFVGLSLIVGGVALAAGAMILHDVAMLPSWFTLAVAVWIVVLAILVLVSLRMKWPWPVLTSALVVSLMLALLWTYFDSMGHDALSGLTPFVALVTGIGVIRGDRWAWPVAFASVTGFGPTILLFAPLAQIAIVGGFVLFVVDAVFLLALTEEFFPTIAR